MSTRQNSHRAVKRRVLVSHAIALAAGGVISSPSRAIEIFAIDNLGATGQNPTVGDRLIRFDSANPVGTVVNIGGTGITGTHQLMSGLEFSLSGTLYSNSQPPTGGGNLYTINTATGAAALVGPLGLPAGVQMTDLSLNPVTGQMLGVTFQDLDPGPNINPVHTLQSVNLTTGQVTPLGTISGLQGPPTGAVSVGLASNSAGVNFLHDVITDRMYQLNGLLAIPMPQTIGVNTNFSQGMTINWRGADEWFLGQIGPPTAPFVSDVRVINNVTGATQAVLGTWPTDPISLLPEYELGDLAITMLAGPRNLIWNGPSPTNQWNTNPANLNWLNVGSMTFFMTGDIANFTDNAVGLVLVDAGGVIPDSTNISNTLGTYTYQGGPINGNGALTKTGAGEAVLQNLNNFTGGVFVNGGVLGVFNNANLGAASAALSFGGGTLRVMSASFSSSRTVNINAPGGTVDTAGFNAALTGPITGPGTLTKAGLGQLSVTNVRSSGLNVGQGEMLVLAGPSPSTPAGVSNVDTLNIAGGPTAPTARIDLSNNAMIVGDTPTDGGPDAEAAILGYISSGYAGGSWGGQGITSTSADFGVGNFALGYGDAGPLGYVSFLGFPVLSTDTLIRYTLYGDANLDGTVNLNDFNLLAANFGLSSGGLWRLGDFDYDGRVNLNDFNRLAANFGLSAGPDGVVGPDDWSALASVVPEPGSMGALLTCGIGFLARRRR